MSFWSGKSESATPEREAAVGRLSALGEPMKPAAPTPAAPSPTTASPSAVATPSETPGGKAPEATPTAAAPSPSTSPTATATATPTTGAGTTTPKPSDAASTAATPADANGMAEPHPTTGSAGGTSEARSVFSRALTEATAEEARASARIAELEQEIERLRTSQQEASDLAGSLRAYLDRI